MSSCKVQFTLDTETGAWEEDTCVGGEAVGGHTADNGRWGALQALVACEYYEFALQLTLCTDNKNKGSFSEKERCQVLEFLLSLPHHPQALTSPSAETPRVLPTRTSYLREAGRHVCEGNHALHVRHERGC